MEIEKIKLDIVGMHCGACATLIQMSVSELEGVKSAFVDYDKKNAELEIDPAKVKKEDIFKKIEEVGYKANLVQ
jgi:Cu+-exporting ATPase